VSARVVTLQPSDMAKLAGTWQGTMTNVAGISWPATLTVSPDGTYTTQGGAFTSQGRAELNDGKLIFVTSYTSGGLAIDDRSGSVVLTDTGDSWRLVGAGRTDLGSIQLRLQQAQIGSRRRAAELG
jgi:hypothetical protein